MRKGIVFYCDTRAGVVEETDRGYRFTYDAAWLAAPEHAALSVTMPLRPEPYESSVFLPFFDGLIPEGWLLDIAQETWKVDPRDRMGLLLTCCRDTIGAVRILPDGVDA